MKIEITECLPQKAESTLSKLHPWMMKPHLFIAFYNEVVGDSINELEEDSVLSELVENAEQAKELAQELLDAYNKLMHWIDKQEEREE